LEPSMNTHTPFTTLAFTQLTPSVSPASIAEVENVLSEE